MPDNAASDRRHRSALARRSFLRRLGLPVILPIVIAVGTMGAPWWWPLLTSDKTIAASATARGCAPFQVFSQNQWPPYGAMTRTRPSVAAPPISALAPNEPIAVDGWIDAAAPYRANPRPFNSNVWFRLANRQGWVSFAAVRAIPTAHDPDPSHGGEAAPTPARCQV